MHAPRSSPLYVIIFVLFLSVSVIITVTLTGYNTYLGTKASRTMAEMYLSAQSDKVILESRRMFEPAIAVIELFGTKDACRFSDYPRIPVELEPSTITIMGTLQRFPQMLSIYQGHDNGDFFEALTLQESASTLRKQLGAPAEAKYVIRTIKADKEGSEHRTESRIWLNDGFKPIGRQENLPPLYDPRTRPWYTAAKNSEGIIQTNYYAFHTDLGFGFTLAHRIDEPCSGVFAVDISLDTMSKFLQQQEDVADGLVFLFTDEGILTGYPDPARMVPAGTIRSDNTFLPVTVSSLSDPVASATYEMYREQGPFRVNSFTLDGEEWLARVTPLPGRTGLREFVGVAVPLHHYTAVFDNAMHRGFAFAVGVFVCMLPVLVSLSRRISRPLALLADEMDKVRHFQLGSRREIHSRIKEVAELTSSFNTMVKALDAFTRYLPKALVRQFVTSGIDPVLGGERRELSLLFTDIANFTDIAGHMQAEKMMLHISRYFQVLSTPVLDTGGTIDKFIGDAMMAFWNAPLPQHDHAQRACEAALRCNAAQDEQNARWKAEGKPPMPTRFGLHAGDCIVGNVGTSDRMNYTAMGTSVNVASRLEALNKFYGTRILVSGSIEMQARKDFIFRTVDTACPRGISEPVELFELLGTANALADSTTFPSRFSPDAITQWEDAVRNYRARRFQEALHAFTVWHEANPDDPLAALYVQRCHAGLHLPEDSDWSPVEHHV
ncbi:MAG: adenylate/guanylate cyclase domain-containing protein [Halodesulfovibrio sp.]